MTSSFDAFQPEAYQPVQYAAPGGPKEAVDMASIIAREYQQGEARNQSFYNQPALNNKVAEYNRELDSNALEQRIEYRQSEFDKLTAFSDKLMEKTQSLLTSFQQANQQRGAILQTNNGLSPEDMAEFQAEKDVALAIENEEERIAALKVVQGKESQRSIENQRRMGTSERIGYTQALMTQRKADYKNDLRNEMSSNNTLKLIDSAGQVFTPMQANTEDRVNIASRAITGRLVQQYGLANARPALLEEMFYGGKDGVRGSMAQYITKRTGEIAINESQQNKQLALIEVVNDSKAGKIPNLQKLFYRHANQLKKDGSSPDFNDAWKGFKGDLEGLVKSGQMTAQQVDEYFKGNLDPQFGEKGMSMADARPSLLAELKALANRSQNTLTTTQNTTGQLAWKKEEEKVNTMMMDRIEAGETFTEQDYKNAQNHLAKMPHGKPSSLLEKNYKMFSQQTQNKESNERVIQQGIADGSITIAQLKEMGGDLYVQYKSQVEQIEKNNTATNNFAKQETAIRGEVRAVAADLGKDEDLSTTAESLVYDILKEVKTKTRELQLSDENYANDPRGAANAAMQLVMAEKRKEGLSRDKPGGAYAPGIKGAFPAYAQQSLGKAVASQEEATQTIVKFDKDWDKFGSSQIDSEEGEPYISTAKLTQNGNNYDSATWRPHPLVERMRQLDPNLGTGLEVTNRLRLARGLKELATPPSLNLDNQTASPEVTQSLKDLESARTPNQVVRAGSQAGVFRPEMVPNGMGQVVVNAANSAGQRPALVAAIAGVETNFRDIGPNHADFNGQDYGAFQVNQYHVDQGLYNYVPGDTQGNANYAMGVYNEMLQQAKLRGVAPQYQEDFALAAYNGGLQTPGGEDYIPVVNGVPQFRAPAQDYLRKIKGRLGQFGDRTIYASQFTMRKDFLTRQATHPDTGAGYTITGAQDVHNRPVVLAEPALQTLAQMVQDSNGIVKWSDIVSAQRSQAKNNSLPGASPSSNHLTGNAIDIHGASKAWIKANGAKYGWVNLVYDGHDGHFDFNQ